MIILFGKTDRDRVVKSRAFVCPNCGKNRYCTHRIVESWFTLFFMPLFRCEVVVEYLKCHDCRHSSNCRHFNPSFLGEDISRATCGPNSKRVHRPKRSRNDSSVRAWIGNRPAASSGNLPEMGDGSARHAS